MKFWQGKNYYASGLIGLLLTLWTKSTFANRQAFDQIFVDLSLGLNRPSSLRGNSGLDQMSNSYFYSLALGKELNKTISVSLELNGTHRKAISTDIKMTRLPANSWSIKSYGFYLNALFNMTKNEEISPYIKVGGGYSFNRVGNYIRVIGPNIGSTDPRIFNAPGINNHSPSYQVGVGVDFKASENYSFKIEYSMINRGRVVTGDQASTTNGKTVQFNKVCGKLSDNVLIVGMKFRL